MSTYRERREARAERLRDWADRREAKSDAALASAKRIADAIPFGQPILVGHHSEARHRRDLDRIDRGMRAGVENARRADDMRSRADGIESQLAGSIYSDDVDAIERLEERIADLEAKRERIKAHNRAHRGDKGCTCAPGCACRSRFEVTRCGCTNHALPAYVLSNLAGNIKRNRDRLEQLRRVAEHGEHPRWITARFDSQCAGCGCQLHKGETIAYFRTSREAKCHGCAS